MTWSQCSPESGAGAVAYGTEAPASDVARGELKGQKPAALTEALSNCLAGGGFPTGLSRGAAYWTREGAVAPPRDTPPLAAIRGCVRDW